MRDACHGEAAARVARWIEQYDPANPELAAYGRMPARSSSGLIATLSATDPSFAGRRNPCNERAAAILDPAGIDIPTARATGRPWTSPRTGLAVLPRRPGAGDRILRLERVLHAAGAGHLAGGGAAALGTLPGLTLLTELELLRQAGLSPREVGGRRCDQLCGDPRLARTEEAARQSADLQSRAMADAARVALGAEIGATMQRLQSTLKPPECRQERRWEGWLTHAAAAAAGSALTLALTASFCSR